MNLTRNPSRQRFIDAIEHRQSDEIPLCEYDPDMKVVNAMTGRNYPMSIHAFDLPADEFVELNRLMGNDMIYFSHVWRVGRREMNDAEGRIHYIDGEIKSEADLDALWYPDIGDIERRLEALVKAGHEAGFGIVVGTQSAAFTSTVAMGFQDFCLAVYDRPEFVLELQQRFHDYAIRELEMVLRYPVDAVKIGSGLVTKNGPMLSPEMMETFETSLLRDIADVVKSRGLPLFFHIDGLVEEMIPGFIEMGVDVLNPIEPCDGKQDIYRLKERFGDSLTLCGNIDVDGVLLRGTPEEIAHDVRDHIDRLSIGGGYIAASSHNLHELIPAENYFAMRDAVHAYRRDQSRAPRT